MDAKIMPAHDDEIIDLTDIIAAGTPATRSEIPVPSSATAAGADGGERPLPGGAALIATSLADFAAHEAASDTALPLERRVARQQEELRELREQLRRLEAERRNGADLLPLLQEGSPLHAGLTAMFREVMGRGPDEQQGAGSAGAEALERRLRQAEQAVAGVAGRCGDAEQRADAFAERAAALDARLSGMEERLNGMERHMPWRPDQATEFSALEQRCAALERKLAALEADMDRRVEAMAAAAAARILREEIAALVAQS